MALDLLRKMAMRLTQRAEARLNRTPVGVSSCKSRVPRSDWRARHGMGSGAVCVREVVLRHSS